jgi:hypothetical protein
VTVIPVQTGMRDGRHIVIRYKGREVATVIL